MRLGTCVAIEFAVGAGLAVALGASTAWGVEQARQHLARRAEAAMLAAPDNAADSRGMRAPITLITPLETRGSVDPAAVDFEMFRGVRDEHLLAPLRESPLVRVRFNRGGSSISLRLDFANGARAAFKPQQTNLQTIPRREVAAYRISRLLGLYSVAPAIGRKFKQRDLLERLESDSRGYAPRMRAEMVAEDGWVTGELSWWIPVIKQAEIDGYRIDGVNGIVTWKRYLTVGREIPEKDLGMAAQISNMVLFDQLINNSDRWTGGNARISEDGDLLYFMDNTLSFGLSDEGHERTQIYLRRSQKFSRSLVERVRGLTAEALRQALTRDVAPFERLVSEEEIEALLKRRDVAIAYIDELIEAHGEDAVLAFP